MYYYNKVMSDLFLEAPFPDTRNTFKGSSQLLDIWRVSYIFIIINTSKIPRSCSIFVLNYTQL